MGLNRTSALATVVLAAGAVACDSLGGGGYEIVEKSHASLAQAAPQAPAPTDTLFTIERVGGRSYDCVRILPGADAVWRADTMLVTQREVPPAGRASASYFCVPYNVWARTEGVEATARVYPADPNGEAPGYNGWIVPGVTVAPPPTTGAPPAIR